MAVIKIVPMPGAKGDKGDDGATGAQGPQGPIGATGPAGADALWSYNGAWQINAAYAVGDVVTYQGQLYYAKAITTAGTLPTDTTKFDLIAAKGADGTNGTNGTNGADALWNFVGEYDNGADYWPGDVVTFAGGTYYRIGEPNPGYYPTDPTYWTTIATPGATGPQGPQGDPGPAGSFVYKSGAVPSTHHGVAGDTKNDIKYDDTHMYICVADYTDGSAAIWKRINWASGNW
jgi:chitodextrinase